MRRLTADNLVERAMEWNDTANVVPSAGVLIMFRTGPGRHAFTTQFTLALHGQWRHVTPREREHYAALTKAWATATRKLKRKRGVLE